jgi:hypothetical protein
MTPKKYAKRPFYVDAVQVNDQNMAEVAAWCEGAVIKAKAPVFNRKSEDIELLPCIKVPVIRPMNERLGRAYVGDWVAKMGAGFKVYTDRSFSQAFDLVA